MEGSAGEMRHMFDTGEDGEGGEGGCKSAGHVLVLE